MRAANRRDIVHGLEQVDIASERRECCRAEVCNSRDVHCWPNIVVDRSVQTTVRILNSRLIQRTAAERRYVADLNSLIGVFQTSAATDGVQSTNGAGVNGIDVVETVSRAELVALIDAVIDTREKVRRIEARGN